MIIGLFGEMSSVSNAAGLGGKFPLMVIPFASENHGLIQFVGFNPITFLCITGNLHVVMVEKMAAVFLIQFGEL